jgi:hypothetical protein
MPQALIGRSFRQVSGDTRRLCNATNRNGAPCGRTPLIGGVRCQFHGGASPVAEQARRERLLAMVDPALDRLLRMFESAPPCETCGRSDADRDPTVLKAIQLVLDRSGFHPTLAVQATRPDDGDEADWAPFLTDEEIATVMTICARAAQRAYEAEAALPAANDVQDGELVDDSPPVPSANSPGD